MKTIAQTLLVAFLLTFGSFTGSYATAPAADEPKPTGKVLSYKSSLYTDAEGKLRVAVDKLVGGTVEVRLMNSAGKEYFIQRIGRLQKVARIKLDVSELPDGAYQVIVTDGIEAKVNNLTLATQQPVFTNRLIALN
ncbi:hypothetical protein [Larkinella ripae]